MESLDQEQVCERGCWRHSPRDSIFVALALLHAVLLLVAPSIVLIGGLLWWNANTISHNFIHLPFFRSAAINRLFSALLSVLLGFPQSHWRRRHLAHHASVKSSQMKVPTAASLEVALVAGLWLLLLTLAPRCCLTVYLPGWLLGLALCQLQGHFEHARGATSHYGWVYNRLFFNDGFHVEHHERPGEHWTRLPACRTDCAETSHWPAVLRWLDTHWLDRLEAVVVRWPVLQRFVLRSHERAVRRLLPRIGHARRIAIVGGGLFPRTALVLRRLLPQARLVVIERDAAHIQTAKRFLQGGAEYEQRQFAAGSREPADLLVVPLAFVGDREALYSNPSAPLVLVHDWLWRRRGVGTIVSFPLLKRLNLVTA